MSLIENVKGGIREIAKIPIKSMFLQEKKLSPDEFVEARNRLKFKCPSWQWFAKLPILYFIHTQHQLLLLLISHHGTRRPQKSAELPPTRQAIPVNKTHPMQIKSIHCHRSGRRSLSGESDEWVAAGERNVATNNSIASCSSADKPILPLLLQSKGEKGSGATL
ncbi:MAG: hypothetical protein EZS28_033630, partial [Streblomastix strix]